MEGEGQGEASPWKPVRRYYCDFCGIGRSKRCLMKAHMLSRHKEEMVSEECSSDREPVSSTTRAECGASFRKPAHLKQHMLSHSPEGFCFYVDENHLKELDVCVKHWIPFKELQNANGLNGLVSGWGTSCEAPSSRPQSRTISFLRGLLLVRWMIAIQATDGKTI